MLKVNLQHTMLANHSTPTEMCPNHNRKHIITQHISQDKLSVPGVVMLDINLTSTVNVQLVVNSVPRVVRWVISLMYVRYTSLNRSIQLHTLI